MTEWTPESLARAFHEAYGRAAGRIYGHGREPEPWDSLPEQSRLLTLAACAELLGQSPEAVAPMVADAISVPVPTGEEFAEAAEVARAAESEGDVSEGDRGDWYADLQRQIDGITAPRVRRVMQDVREPFRK